MPRLPTDECTSAVSVDVEEKLYAEAEKMGITSVTLSQRLALTQFHRCLAHAPTCHGPQPCHAPQLLLQASQLVAHMSAASCQPAAGSSTSGRPPRAVGR